MNLILRVFEVLIAMAKVGIVGFGGGNAMVSLVEREVVDIRKWMTIEQFQEVLGCSYAVPGLSAGKLAAYVGWQHAGPLGMFAGLIGIWLPGMVMLFAFIYFLKRYQETTWYPRLMNGILFASAGLIAASIFSALPRGAASPTSWKYIVGLIIMAGVFIVVWKLKQIPPVLAVLAGGIIGLLLL